MMNILYRTPLSLSGTLDILRSYANQSLIFKSCLKSPVPQAGNRKSYIVL